MTVYVESNFVLEQALQQEQSDACDSILDLAVSGLISLVVPAFSLAEPHQAIELKAKARNRLSNELRTHMSELGRSKPYRALPDDFTALASGSMTYVAGGHPSHIEWTDNYTSLWRVLDL